MGEDTILDDIYQSPEQEQEAHQILSAAMQPNSKLVWAGRPRAAGNYYSRNFLRLFESFPWGLTLPVFLLLVSFFRDIEGSFFLLLKLFVVSFVIGCLGLLIWIELDRRKTYYGIADGKVWVKSSRGKLVSYSIAQLPRLKRQDNTIYYSTIVGKTYTKYALLQNIPKAAMVFELMEESISTTTS